MEKSILKEHYKNNFKNTKKRDGFFFAPGRVNLIGEHTDYNNGFVLPMAIDRRIYAYLQVRDDKQINIYSIDLDRYYTTTTEKLKFNEENSWSNYIVGVVSELQKEGYHPSGFNMTFSGDIPQGAGLSSSAALEVVTVYGLAELNNFEISPVKKALIAQSAENNFVGVECGIMDQYISCLGEKDKALLIDCDSYDYNKVPIQNKKYQFLIIDSKVQRGLVDSEYNLRRQQCNNVVKYFKENFAEDIESLRDININELFRHEDKINETDYKRATHVLTENRRVLEFADSVEDGNYEKAGQLMYASHLSLKNEYEVSCEELDFLIETALELKGVLGARMTGAGFGGCTVNLIKKDYKSKIINSIKTEYKKEYKKEPDFYTSRPAQGASSY
ncbi:MAG TPA: galactokinase [Halanaerobiales bacterium]|nr:galactokinase [Halanaerobiales bacterium]